MVAWQKRAVVAFSAFDLQIFLEPADKQVLSPERENPRNSRAGRPEVPPLAAVGGRRARRLAAGSVLFYWGGSKSKKKGGTETDDRRFKIEAEMMREEARTIVDAGCGGCGLRACGMRAAGMRERGDTGWMRNADAGCFFGFRVGVG